MDKFLVLILEDDVTIRNGFRQIFEDEFSQTNLELEECKSYEEYETFISQKEKLEKVRCFVMDLSISPSEKTAPNFKSTQLIKIQYNQNRVPIFVHSAYLEKFKELDDKGSVFKVLKGQDSTKEICNIIAKMYESGFLDIFCTNGSIESKIMEEIHSAFVEQFKPNEIEKIIDSVKNSGIAGIRERTIEIFERIALRAVYQNFINKVENSKVNAVEHYYRRNITTSFFTGDIFKHKSSQKQIFIATPRCNIANNNFEEILVCEINPIKPDQKTNFLNPKADNPGETKGQKSLRGSITDDVTNSYIGERFRFLPPAPLFDGGFVDFKLIRSIKDLSEYNYEISISEELTNDVIRKMTGYLQRGGISDTNYLETQNYLS